jgi:tetratricopeptide (TPR) repeat protein
MGKVVKFPTPAPEIFGLQRVQKQKVKSEPKKPGQLDLFTGAKIVKLNQLSTFEEALLQDETHNPSSAKDLYLKAIKEGDSLADAYCNLGIIESAEGNRTKAIDFFTKSLQQDPRHYESHYNLANLYSEVGEYALAKFHYEISIEIEPNFPNGYFNLGITLALNKEFQEAMRVLYRYRDLTTGETNAQLDAILNQLSSLQ